MKRNGNRIASNGHMVDVSSHGRLFLLMQAVNVASLSLLLTPRILSTFGFETVLTTDYDYIHSIEPFIPEALLQIGFHQDLPIQTVQISSVTVYFPGVAIECVLGTIQCMWLGLDLLYTRRRQGRYRTTVLPAVALFLYAGMCLSALPLHCFKDVGVLDIASESVLAKFLLWADVFCTASVPPIVLLSGLIENDLVDMSRQHLAWIILLLNALLTWIGVVSSNRWITFGLHVVFQVLFLNPFFYLTRKRTLELECPHGFLFLNLGAYGSVVGIALAFCFATFLSLETKGDFCLLTFVFLASRLGMVQYWAYCNSQAQCNCIDKRKVE